MTGRCPAPLLLSARWRLHRRPALSVLACALAAVLPAGSALLMTMSGGAGAPLAIAGALMVTAVAGAFATSAIALWRGRSGGVFEVGRDVRAMERTGTLMQGRLDRIERAAERIECSVATAADLLEDGRGRRRSATGTQNRDVGGPRAQMLQDRMHGHAGPMRAGRPSGRSRAGAPAALRRADAGARPDSAAFEKEIERYLTVSRKV